MTDEEMYQKYGPPSWAHIDECKHHNISDEKYNQIMTESQLPMNLVRFDMMDKHSVDKLVKVFLAFIESKFQLDYRGVCKISTNIQTLLQNEHDVFGCYKLLMKQCTKYNLDTYHIKFAFNRLVDTSIRRIQDNILYDVRQELEV